MTFRGGIAALPDRRQPEIAPLEILPVPSFVSIPLVNRDNESPARPLVKPGDVVSTGQMIGEACDEASAPVHASLCGTVRRLDRFPGRPGKIPLSVVIEYDGREEFVSPIPYATPWTEADPEAILHSVKLSGIIDGNAALHAKLGHAARAGVATLIVNAVTDEPFRSADSRLILDNVEKFLTGALIALKIAGAARGLIALGDNSADLIAALADNIGDTRFGALSLVKVQAKYPHRHERLLIRTCTGHALSATDDPVDAGCVVLDAPSTVALRDAVMECIPWYRRIVTVAGPLVATPKNLLVPIGTPQRLLLAACGTDFSKINKVVTGGPLSGVTVHDLDAPVTKSTDALIAFPAQGATHHHHCIRCRRCLKVCPMRLSPSSLAQSIMREDFARAAQDGVEVCIGCGCCSYVCPSKIDLVHLLEFGKLRVGQSASVNVPRSAA
jgi:Na+-translocating ferredoxin:NAD+ oxidoreductase subunit C